MNAAMHCAAACWRPALHGGCLMLQLFTQCTHIAAASSFMAGGGAWQSADALASADAAT